MASVVATTAAASLISNISPTRGPQTGGTLITIKGAGFFRNGTYYDPSAPNCGAPYMDAQGRDIVALCIFETTQESVGGAGYIIDHSTVMCLTPDTLADVDLNDRNFDVHVQVDSGPITDTAVEFYFDSYADVSVSDYIPKDGHLDTETTVVFYGNNFIDTGYITCLIANLDQCNIEEPHSGLYSIPARPPQCHYCVVCVPQFFHALQCHSQVIPRWSRLRHHILAAFHL